MEDRLVIAILIGCLSGVGCYLILQNSLVRILIGLFTLSNAVNLFLFCSSDLNRIAPVGKEFQNPDQIADPLPQALVLTAIVIGFGIISLLTGVVLKLNEKLRCDDFRMLDAED